jgi:hypothetical protein
MTRPRRWIVCGVIALAGLVTLCIYLSRAYLPKPGVTWGNVQRIEPGMTQPEVEAVLGRPPQTWSRGPIPITDNSPPGYHTVLLWSDMQFDILVYLDGSGRVIGREGVGSCPLSWYDRLRHRLGL